MPIGLRPKCNDCGTTEHSTRKASASAADLFLKVIAHSRNVVRKDPYFRLHMVKQDEDDNKFIDCAFACQADYIVTNDSHFSDIAETPFPKFQIIDLDTFANIQLI